MKNILIGICGGIAAYKSIETARLLQKQGYKVRFVLTDAAQAFVSPMTLQAISGEPVRSALFDQDAEAAMGHIELARWADVLLIAPATANTLAKLAHGIADDLLSTLYLATDAEVVIAPAMNRLMWAHPATQANIDVLSARDNHRLLPVGEGEQACGEFGAGRMLEPQEIVAAFTSPQDWQGQKVVITAGPTREAIDPVRYLTNHSSGKMGYALAAAAARRGAAVTLITGPTTLATPAGVERIDVVSAQDMHTAAMSAAVSADVFIAAAAVSDYRINEPHAQKHKKTVHGALSLELVENPDIVADVASLARDKRPFTIGFAAETEQLLEHARAKLRAKGLDMIIANDVSEGVFGSDDNRVTLLSESQEIALPRQNKTALAKCLLTEILKQKI
ncbi:bifunctional phosphopantothenoylcysteine decarboxylase/phosphopantothenate--cysteine ligase CoaBC [Suttonella sp. R2A3]|uniref:bifunctional phosphopantothenoylcysteine decarboxylase/phosphopantothenate--cysteine ligase CoaBC n=1 Tax=Suttonella sp. R2A3 TaxID=2908648 RepID=UPI001F484010|nr:bifunctional phosphopantothenoylcysteine decarboxylase/phosphopantothenate--cysteine ligase CoaBC [Suttonella sp. R2A3]UJF23738.1 bifunctional phosphopantothenoylcysteine decarboxylase/phosphopantothenate--cysteine ligase CoaBC [Suttonella sp. R2A3]